MKINRVDRLLFLVLLFSLFLYADSASAQNRKSVDPRGAFAKLTGHLTQIDGPLGPYGNGFIVGADGCHVLTNFHVAFGKSTDGETGVVQLVDNFKIGHAVDFSFELDAKSGKFSKTVKAKVVEFGNYEAGTSRGFLGDIALLRLETCAGKDYGHLEIDRPADGKTLPTGMLMTVSAGRNTAGKNEILIEEGCRSESMTPVTGMILSNCEAVPGMSGSMLLEQGADKKWRVVGITTDRNVLSDGTKVSQAISAKVINKFLDGLSFSKSAK